MTSKKSNFLNQIITACIFMAAWPVCGSSTPTPSSVHEFKTGTLIECTSQFSLCAYTDCPKTGDGSTAACTCPVYFGKNWGETTCDQRAAASEKNAVYSEYSPRNLLTASKSSATRKAFDPALLCDAGSITTYQYVDCFDVQCHLSSDKTSSICSCPVTKNTGKTGFLMEANNCEEGAKLCEKIASSSSEIAANSAPTAFATKVVNSTLKAYGENLNSSMVCTPETDTKTIISKVN